MKRLSWRALNDKLPMLTELEVRELLDSERSTNRRASHLLRLHQRYCALRDAREREEVLNDARYP